MGYQDKQLQFSIAQAETSEATHISDHVYDLTHKPRNVIEGMYFTLRISTAIVSAGGGTFTVDLVTSAAAGLSTPQVLHSSGLISNATLVAYAANTVVYAVRVPPVMLLRYMGVRYTIATAVFTAGAWDTYLTPLAPYHIAATP